MKNFYHQKNKFKEILATVFIVALLHRKMVAAVATTPVEAISKSTFVERLTGGGGGNWQGPITWTLENRGWHMSEFNIWETSGKI